MEKEDAIKIMHHLASRIEDGLAIEDLVSPFAEFMAHMEPGLSETDFAFLATVGAVIYRKGANHYDSGMETSILMERLRKSLV
jgi:hypothetical protein